MNASTHLYFVGLCTVDGNIADLVGGGIALISSPQVYVRDGTLTVSNNQAQRGSAFYYNTLTENADRAIHDVNIAGNVASVGGTVYWVFDELMRSEPLGMYDESVLWGYNEAPYGNVTATQAVHLIAPTSFEVQSYGSFISPAPVRTLRDYYGQLMPLGGPTAIQTSIAGASADQCDGRFPYLSGTDVLAAGVEMVAGEAALGSLDASCAPNGHITLHFAAQLNDLVELDISAYTITNTTAISFRNCSTGEVIVNGQCVVCPRGTFSLEETVTTDTICQDCIGVDGVTSCFASTMVLKKGYWRRYPTSLAVLSCVDDLSGCNGGSATGDGSCMEGYEGALCSVCSEGYYRSENRCLQCSPDKPTFSPVVIFYMCIAVIATLVVALALYRRITKSTQHQAAGKYSAFLTNLATWLNQVKKSMSVQLKILITTFQITSTIPASMKVEFPVSFAKYLSAMSVFNLNIVSVVPLNCGHSKYNFIDKMVMITLAPIFASIGLLLLCILEYAVYAGRARPAHVTDEEVQAKKSKIVTRYLTYFFFLTYLVLPSVSTTIFKTFLCTDIDPLHEDASKSDLFLTADMRVSCSTDYYRRGVAYASIMIIVYVVGIPAMYLALLWRCRKAIMGRFDPPDAEAKLVEASNAGDQKARSDVAAADSGATDAKGAAEVVPGGESTATEPVTPQQSAVGNLSEKKDPASQTALMIAFLFEAYEPEFWYWEVVETTRRLMLTAVLSVCGTGTAAQAIFAVLLALMYIKLYGFYSPYNAVADDIVAETGQFQIFLSFLGALIYQRHLLGNEWNGYVSILLILINTAVFFLFLYFGGRTLIKAIKESKFAETEAFKRGMTLMHLPTIKQFGRFTSPRNSFVPRNHSKVYVEPDAAVDGLSLPDQNLVYIRARNGGHEGGAASAIIPERSYQDVANLEIVNRNIDHIIEYDGEHV